MMDVVVVAVLLDSWLINAMMVFSYRRSKDTIHRSPVDLPPASDVKKAFFTVLTYRNGEEETGFKSTTEAKYQYGIQGTSPRYPLFVRKGKPTSPRHTQYGI